MNVLVNTQVQETKWMELLERSKYATPFQTPECHKLYNESEGFSSDVFAVESDNEYKALVVVTVQKESGIKRFLSVRGIVYGGVVLLPNNSIYLENLIDKVRSFYKRKLIYLEIRNHFDYGEHAATFNKYGWNFNEHLNVIIDFQDKSIEDVMANMNYNRRRQIQHSYKHGAEVRLAKNEEEVKELFYILEDLYKNRVKLPLSPLSYFLDLYKSPVGKVFIVSHEGKVIGGAFCVYYDEMSIYTLYYAGLRGYHKKIYPTHLAVHGGIEYALENKLKMFDFMGAGKPDVDYGVRKYKMEFGGELVEHGRFLNVFNPFLYKIGMLGLELLKKIK